MGTVTTARVITGPIRYENHGQPGNFGLVSRDPSQMIRVIFQGASHAETIEIVKVGDSCSFDLLNVDSITIEADSYPTAALINYTNADIQLDSAPFVTLVPGVTGFTAHFDGTIAGAATTTLWTPAAGKRFVIDSFLISTSVANRVALVDGSDIAGKRIAAPYLAANGGMIGGPYQSQAVGLALKLVTLAGGNVFVSVDGFESA